MTKVYMGFKREEQLTNGVKYEIGKTYEIKGELEICEYGFDYSNSIVAVGEFHDLKCDIVCEVEILGNSEVGIRGQLYTDKIKIVRELSREEITQYFKDNWEELIKGENWIVDSVIAYMGFGLDILVKNKDCFVRTLVADNGRPQDLDVLVFDKECLVRCAVARQGREKDLDILVQDKETYVKEAMAMCGYKLNELINDRELGVRLEIARYGRPQDLDILVSDKNGFVRREVARQGRAKDLDILVQDIDPMVRLEVAKHGREEDLYILFLDDNEQVSQAYNYARELKKA